MTLADRLIVMNAGRAEQIGTPMEVYEQAGHGLRRGLHRLAGDELPAGAGGRRRRASRCSTAAAPCGVAARAPRRHAGDGRRAARASAAVRRRAARVLAARSRWSSRSAPTRCCTSATATTRSSRGCRTATSPPVGLDTSRFDADPERVYLFDAAHRRADPLTMCGLPAWPYPRLVAHRGAGKLAPENTLTAMRVGHAHGYRMVEFDVKLSADNVAFLLHDATLERTTSGTRPRRRAAVARAVAARRGQLAFGASTPASRCRRSRRSRAGRSRNGVRATSRSSRRRAASARPARRWRSTRRRCGATRRCRRSSRRSPRIRSTPRATPCRDLPRALLAR